MQITNKYIPVNMRGSKEWLVETKKRKKKGTQGTRKDRTKQQTNKQTSKQGSVFRGFSPIASYKSSSMKIAS